MGIIRAHRGDRPHHLGGCSHVSWRFAGADWLLADGTFVEYAGLTGSEPYDRKMAIKARLAAMVGIELIIVYPSDLARLNTVFAAHLPGMTVTQGDC